MRKIVWLLKLMMKIMKVQDFVVPKIMKIIIINLFFSNKNKILFKKRILNLLNLIKYSKIKKNNVN